MAGAPLPWAPGDLQNRAPVVPRGAQSGEPLFWDVLPVMPQATLALADRGQDTPGRSSPGNGGPVGTKHMWAETNRAHETSCGIACCPSPAPHSPAQAALPCPPHPPPQAALPCSPLSTTGCPSLPCPALPSQQLPNPTRPDSIQLFLCLLGP